MSIDQIKISEKVENFANIDRNEIPERKKDLQDIAKIWISISKGLWKIKQSLSDINLDDDGVSEIMNASRNFIKNTYNSSSIADIENFLKTWSEFNGNVEQSLDSLKSINDSLSWFVNALWNVKNAEDNVLTTVSNYWENWSVFNSIAQFVTHQYDSHTIAKMILNWDPSELSGYNWDIDYDSEDDYLEEDDDTGDDYIEEDDDTEDVNSDIDNDVKEYPDFDDLNPFVKNAITKMAYMNKPWMSYKDYYDKYKDSWKFDRYINDKNSEKATSIASKVLNFFN